MAEYSVGGLLVGPYLPNKEILLDGVSIIPTDQQSWRTPHSPVSAQAGDGDSQVTFTPNVTTFSTPTILEYTCKASSSKEADIAARQKFEHICDALSVGCIENKYFFQIISVKRLSEGADPESRMSEPIRVVNYEYRPLHQQQVNYVKDILSLDNANANNVVAAFGKALRNGKIFELYKVMEMIAQILNDDVKAIRDTEEITNMEQDAINSLLEALVTDNPNEVKKIAIKKASDELRRLNLEQNGKRIAAAAEYLGLSGEVAKVINRAIRYRNKVMAHSDSVPKSLADSGPKDIQESARFFVIRYLDKKFNVKLPENENVPYKDVWYRVTYANSVALKDDGTSEA